MNKKSMIKILGIAATLIGGAATLISEWVKDRELDEKIDEKVNKALADKEES